MQKLVHDLSIAGTTVLPLAVNGATIVRGGRNLLAGVDFEVSHTPQITVLLGPNGAGKSLLIRVLAGLVEADKGHVSWAGTPPDRGRAGSVGIVFQKPVLLRRSVLANMNYALALRGLAKSERTERASVALQTAGLAHLADQQAESLSAGEQQRLALARAIACRPQVLILDEPTANLDPASTAAIESQLAALRAQSTPVLFITHDLAQARRIADRIVFIHLGSIREAGPAETFFLTPLSPEARGFIRGELLA